MYTGSQASTDLAPVWSVTPEDIRVEPPSALCRKGCNCCLLCESFPTQGSKPGILDCRQILYCLGHQGNDLIVPSTEKPAWALSGCRAGAAL